METHICTAFHVSCRFHNGEECVLENCILTHEETTPPKTDEDKITLALFYLVGAFSRMTFHAMDKGEGTNTKKINALRNAIDALISYRG